MDVIIEINNEKPPPILFHNLRINNDPMEQNMGQWNEYIPNEISPKNLNGLISSIFWTLANRGIAMINQEKKRIAPYVLLMKHNAKDISPDKNKTIFVQVLPSALLTAKRYSTSGRSATV